MPTYGFSLNAEAATYNSLTISVTTALTGTSGETFTVAAEVSGTTVASATVTTGAEGESVNAIIMGLSPSTTYTITGKVGETTEAASITASTTAPSSDPRTATEAQWQDLAVRVKAKANSADIPSTYWGQTANNGAVSGMLSFGTNGYVNGTNTTVTIYADNSGGADPFSFSHSGFDVADKKITSVANGTSSHDAVNKSQLDAKPTITMTSTDPGEGSALAANNYVAVYGGDPIIMDYSTNEVNTGAKWIDGSAIYKKTLNTGTLPSSAGTSATTVHNITDLYKVIKIEGYAYNGTVFSSLPYISPSSTFAVAQILVNTTSVMILASTDLSAFTESYVTLYYTKSS